MSELTFPALPKFSPSVRGWYSDYNIMHLLIIYSVETGNIAYGIEQSEFNKLSNVHTSAPPINTLPTQSALSFLRVHEVSLVL